MLLVDAAYLLQTLATRIDGKRRNAWLEHEETWVKQALTRPLGRTGRYHDSWRFTALYQLGQVLNQPEWSERGVELFVGYYNHEVGFTLNNIRILEDPLGMSGGASFSGLVSTWDVEFEGARLGARTALPLGKGFSFSGELALLFGTAKGHGNWMLRDYLFDMEADGGGVDLTVALQLSLTKNVTVQAGGRYYNFVAEDGTESGTQPGSTYTNEPIVDEISVDQLGWFIGVLATF